MSSSNVIFRRFLRNPGRIGAIAPSSNGLCRELVTWLEIDNAAAVAELGPGTGAVTRELLRQKGKTTRFFAVELDPEICKVFRETMPGVKLYNANACELENICREENIEALDAVVCGLPWASFPEELQRSILSALVKSLAPRGKFTTFAYLQGLVLPAGKRFRKLLNEYFSNVETSKVVWRNLPPAITYRCIK